MRGQWRAAVLLVGLGWFIPDPAASQALEEYRKWCFTDHEEHDLDQEQKRIIERVISGCTAAIRSGRLTDKDRSIFLNSRGHAYNSIDRFDRAIEDLDEAIRIYPSSSAPFVNRGVSYGSKKDYDRAIEDFNEAIRLDSNDAQAFANLGGVYHLKGQHKRALPYYDEAIRLFLSAMSTDKTIKLRKRASRAFFHRGDVYNSMNQTDRGFRDYDEAIRLDPDSADALNARCWRRAIIGELDLAEDDCDSSLNIRKNANTYDSKGLVYLKSGLLSWAEDNYTLALYYKPKDASSLFGRGLASQMRGDFQAAERDKREALRIEPAVAEDYKRYGIAVDSPPSTICQFSNGWHNIAPHSSFVGIACRDKEGRKGKVVASGSQTGPELHWTEAALADPYRELGVSKDAFSGSNSWKAAACEFTDAGTDLDVECALMEVAKNETIVDGISEEFERLRAVNLKCPESKDDGTIDYHSKNDLGYRRRTRLLYKDGRAVYLNSEAFKPDAIVSTTGFHGKAEEFDDRPVVKRYIDLMAVLKDKVCFGSAGAKERYFDRLNANRVRL